MSIEKLKEAIHYICSKSDPKKLGYIKLNKIILLADKFHYLKFGQSITGCSFVKKDFGPVPKQGLDAIHSLKDEGKISAKLLNQSMSMLPYSQWEYISLIDCEGNSLTSSEKELIDFFISDICENHTASSISEYTHDSVWETAKQNEEIPLNAYLTRPGSISSQDKLWAQAIIANLL